MGLRGAPRAHSLKSAPKSFKRFKLAFLMVPASAAIFMVHLALSTRLPHQLDPSIGQNSIIMSKLERPPTLRTFPTSSNFPESLKSIEGRGLGSGVQNSSGPMLTRESRASSQAQNGEPKEEDEETDGDEECTCSDFNDQGLEAPELLELEGPDIQSEYGLYPLCPSHSVTHIRGYGESDSSKGTRTWFWDGQRLKRRRKVIKERLRLNDQDTLGGPDQSSGSSADSPIFYPSSLPNLKYVRERYIRMYGHWRLAASRLRAQLVIAREPPYVKGNGSAVAGHSFVHDGHFIRLLAQAAEAAGLAVDIPKEPLGMNTGGGRKTEERGRAGKEGWTRWNSSSWANEKGSLEGFCSFARTIFSLNGTKISSPYFPKLLLFDGSLLYLKYDGLKGPQGDIMQWADLMIALHVIGYGPGLTIPLTYRPCPHLMAYDLVFADYVGLTNSMCLYRWTFLMGAPFALRCKIRLLDLFGTQEPFNAGHRKGYGNLCLPSLRQILTLQPEHAPENTFLGFASPLPSVPSRFWRSPSIECEAPSPGLVLPRGTNSSHGCQRSPARGPLLREWKGLVWAKGKAYFANTERGAKYDVRRHLAWVADRIPLIATVPAEDRAEIPPYISITGRVLTPAEVTDRLSRYSLVVGLGTPLMASGLLEVVGSPGLHFLNPKFDPPWNRSNSKAMEFKPTNQGITSQHPFLEHAFQRPFVYTVNASDKKAVREALAGIRRDYDKLHHMSRIERQREFTLRRGQVLTAMEPFYGAESLIIRVHNIVSEHEECFDSPETNIGTNATGNSTEFMMDVVAMQIMMTKKAKGGPQYLPLKNRPGSSVRPNNGTGRTLQIDSRERKRESSK